MNESNIPANDVGLYRMASSYMGGCDQFTSTKLAEEVAIALDHPEWLEDPEHWIWELAAYFMEEE